jgi:hypothetical protein
MLLAAATALCACGESRPIADNSSGICQTGIQPTLSSIEQNLFQVACISCHSGALAASSGGLDLSGDSFGRLVNVPAVNQQAQQPPPGLLRVRPGDPDNSLLWQKLVIGATNPQFGQGMPLNSPGSVCQETRDAVRNWILAGALDN